MKTNFRAEAPASCVPHTFLFLWAGSLLIICLRRKERVGLKHQPAGTSFAFLGGTPAPRGVRTAQVGVGSKVQKCHSLQHGVTDSENHGGGKQGQRLENILLHQNYGTGMSKYQPTYGDGSNKGPANRPTVCALHNIHCAKSNTQAKGLRARERAGQSGCKRGVVARSAHFLRLLRMSHKERHNLVLYLPFL